MTHSDSRPQQDLSERLSLEYLRQFRHATETGTGSSTRSWASFQGRDTGPWSTTTDRLIRQQVYRRPEGYPPDEFTSRWLGYNDSMLSEDRSATREAFLTALRKWKMYNAEHRIQGRLGLLELVARPRGVSLGLVPRFIEVVEPGQSTPEAVGSKQRAFAQGRVAIGSCLAQFSLESRPRAHVRRNLQVTDSRPSRWSFPTTC